MIKYIKKQENFFNIDRRRTMIYDSGVGFMDLKAHSLKGELESKEIDEI